MSKRMGAGYRQIDMTAVVAGRCRDERRAEARRRWVEMSRTVRVVRDPDGPWFTPEERRFNLIAYPLLYLVCVAAAVLGGS